MAAPIAWEAPPQDPTLELRSRLERASGDHAEAILEMYELLQGLHDRGVLDALRGALGAGDRILESAVEAARTPESVREMRNLLLLHRVLGSIDPERLKNEQTVGWWALLRKLRSRDCLRGLAAVVTILESFGRQLR